MLWIVWQTVSAVLGVGGLILVSTGRRWAWFVGLASQLTFLTYVIVTGQYGLVLSGVGYTIAYVLNIRKWRRDVRQERAGF